MVTTILIVVILVMVLGKSIGLHLGFLVKEPIVYTKNERVYWAILSGLPIFFIGLTSQKNMFLWLSVAIALAAFVSSKNAFRVKIK